ncbi:MAG: VapC toxin family PIN domain ribonuclease [Pseudorhodoferax sp.]
MTVLVDTSVWVAHFRARHAALVELLEADQALTHPMVLLELACGTPPAPPAPPAPRARTLAALGQLRQAAPSSTAEVMAFVERERLYGLGCGLVDMTLLASTLITPGARLWTLDRPLAALARRFGIAHAVPMD